MTIFFHDLSNHNAALPDGPCISKATEGTTYVDVNFVRNRNWTLSHGWPFLAYHFLAHGNIAAQVDHVVSVVGRGQPLMLDVEAEDGQPDVQLADVLAFADMYPQRGGGRTTLAYIPQWYWRDHWHSPSLSPVAQRGMGLISSVYTAYSDTGPGWAPYGGVTPIIWQYTSTPLDSNAFKGTQAQLAAVFAGGGAVTTPDSPAEVIEQWRVSALYNDAPAIEPGGPNLGALNTNQLHARLVAMQTTIEAIKAQLDGQDGPVALTPADIAAIAKAVNDDAAARLAQ